MSKKVLYQKKKNFFKNLKIPYQKKFHQESKKVPYQGILKRV